MSAVGDEPPSGRGLQLNPMKRGLHRLTYGLAGVCLLLFVLGVYVYFATYDRDYYYTWPTGPKQLHGICFYDSHVVIAAIDTVPTGPVVEHEVEYTMTDWRRFNSHWDLPSFFGFDYHKRRFNGGHLRASGIAGIRLLSLPDWPFMLAVLALPAALVWRKLDRRSLESRQPIIATVPDNSFARRWRRRATHR